MGEWKMKACLDAIGDSIQRRADGFPKGITRDMYHKPFNDPAFRYHDGSPFQEREGSYQYLGDILGFTREDFPLLTLSALSVRFAAFLYVLAKTCTPVSRAPAIKDFLHCQSPELEKLLYAFSGISLSQAKQRVEAYFTCSPDDPGLNKADGYVLSVRYFQDEKTTYPLSSLAIASTPAVLFTLLDEAMLKAGSFYNARNPGTDYPSSVTIERNGELILKTRVVPTTIMVGGPTGEKVWDYGRPAIDWECCEWKSTDLALLQMVVSLASVEAGWRYKGQCLTDALGI
jgi:hypothetical protein